MSVSWEEAESLDYVTLAKAGGRKDLLFHHEHERQGEAQSYSQSVDWFCHPSPPPRETPSPYKSQFTESWMVWNASNSRLPKLPPHGAKQSRAAVASDSEVVKLPQLSKGNETVDVSRLLSLDYQREWLEERERRKRELHRKAKAKQLARKKKLQEHTMKQRAAKGTKPVANKRYIMSKFAQVPPKLKLPPI